MLKHERGLAYVAYLIANGVKEPIHGLALALRIRELESGQGNSGDEVVHERNLALDDAEGARALFMKQQELERIVHDEEESEPVKQEALRDLEAIYSFQRKNVSRTRSVAQKASDSVGKAIKRFYGRLARAVNSDGSPNVVLRAFALHIKERILIPSGRGLCHGGCRPAEGCGGFFRYDSAEGVVWSPHSAARVQSPQSKVQSPVGAFEIANSR